MTSAGAAAEQHFLQFAIQWASIALIYYDYILTFPSEFKFIWKSKLQVSTVIYIFYRYALLANVLYLLAISNKLGNKVMSVPPRSSVRVMPTAIPSCDAWYKTIGVFSILGRAAIIFTFLMRTYAVYNRSVIVLVVLGAVGLACMILDCLHVSGVRCHGRSTKVLYLLAIVMLVFEAMTTLLTFFRSLQALRIGGGSIALRRHTLFYLVGEQGVFYFGLITTITIVAMVLDYRAKDSLPQHLLDAFILPLSGLLTARFLLGIRAYDQYAAKPLGRATTQEISSFGDVNFRAPGGRQGSSVADEFGEDPMNMVFRAAESLAASDQSASEGGSDEHREAKFSDLLGEMRRRFADAEANSVYGEGTASLGGSGFEEEKFEPTDDMNDLEGGDGHASRLNVGTGKVQRKGEVMVEGSMDAE